MTPALPDDRDFAVFAVLDGHGGRQVAGFVRTHLPAELGTALVQEEAGPLTDKKLKKAILFLGSTKESTKKHYRALESTEERQRALKRALQRAP